jgi:SPP1 family predicted phage head-tail adaptor
MIAGKLRHVIAIESPTEAKSISGAIVNAPWSVFAAGLRAEIEDLGGSEKFTGDNFTSLSTHKITIRYYPGITTKMRVNFKGRFFDILNGNNVENRNRELDLMCREGRSHGNV